MTTSSIVSAPNSPSCHVCGTGDVTVFSEYATVTRVTSDCKPWPAGGRLCFCARCGTVQKAVDDKWRSEIRDIYASYSIYFQASGIEQAVFTPESGQALLRSDRLVQRIIAHILLPPQGRLIDIGCGNGAFLGAFARAVPGWRLAGTEWSERYRSVVEAIPGVEQLYTGDITEVPGHFTIVSMIHALEHIPAPVDLLQAVGSRLEPGGLLFIEVPNAAANPFDLLVADHASHFTPKSLRSLLDRAGFEIAVCATDWVAKEISVLARPNPRPLERRAGSLDEPLTGLRWLVAVRDAARAATGRAPRGSFGLFGSSIAATWLAHELAGAADFFVDEDPNRRGCRFMERPILAPVDVPPGAHVFIGLGGDLAPQIAGRLRRECPAVTWDPAPSLGNEHH